MDKRKLFYSFSPKGRMLIRKLYYFPSDLWNTITGKRHKYEPRKGDIYVGAGNFIGQGQDQLNVLKKYAGLKKSDYILDVGCGIGRSAVALTEFLDTNGKYEGFDVVEEGILWCTKKITKDFPNFSFKYVPLHNDLYNDSQQKSVDFTYPYADLYFDKAFLFSVFTHMELPETAHYLKEIHRVLKKEGQCLATFFLYDQNKVDEVITSNPEFIFRVKRDGYYLMNDQVKSANVAFAESSIEKMAAESGLKITKIIKGYWRKDVAKSDENSFQDIVVFKKEA